VTDGLAVLAALRAGDQLVGEPGPLPALRGVTADSRRVEPGMLFCAVEGSVADGHRFVAEAARRGAAAALVTRDVADITIPLVRVRDSRRAAAVAAAAWYGFPARGLRLVGVTGTNGKSTTVALIRHLLNARGDTGTIGTLGISDGALRNLPEDAGLTTPGPVELQAGLAALRARGASTVVMEASSHALHQQRVHGLTFAAAVYTNLTHDHLDYHADYHEYLSAKMLLSEHLVPTNGVEAVNADDPAWGTLPARPGARRIRFGTQGDPDVRAEQVVQGATGTQFDLVCGGARVAVSLPLLGEFNVSNALAASATAWGLGESPAVIGVRLATAPQIPGRMEQIVGTPFTVLRDYAHTPDALERLLRALKPITRGRLIVVFGAGGDRDRRKRPVMGRVAAQGADLAIVTSDNPRTEDPERIIDDIVEGFEGVAHMRIVDRREAIVRALRVAQPGDTVVLAGKGHETYQVVGTTKVPFDEAVIVRGALEAGR
jgi:UDP-N-acetylmuramoyl-L-alanyl-D-glutamate--2,6-diaminopimelate ligase